MITNLNSKNFFGVVEQPNAVLKRQIKYLYSQLAQLEDREDPIAAIAKEIEIEEKQNELRELEA